MYKNGVMHTVYAYGINTAPGKPNTFFGTKTFTLGAVVAPTPTPTPMRTPTPTVSPPLTPTPTPPNALPAGTLVGACTGWPSPHIELQWSAAVPNGSLPASSNSVLRSVNGGIEQWFFAGAFPGAYGTRISGVVAQPWGVGGYPNPNYTVYDLRDDGVAQNTTYTYKVKYRPETSSNTYSITVNSLNCGGPTPTPSVCPPGTVQVGTTNSVPPNPICAPEMADGRIDGVCTWSNGAPRVNLTWSRNPPPNRGAASMNVLQKGDCFVNDINAFWCSLPNNPQQYSYTDTSVTADTQYQYRVQYRSDMWSVNTFSIYTSTRNCGVPPPPPGPLTISPNYQTVPPNVSATLTATGGDGSYLWTAPTGTISGTGNTIGVVYVNDSTSTVTKTVTVRSGAQTASATVLVTGVQTFSDDIALTGRGTRYILINDDEPITISPDVLLTMAHGFANEATVSITMQIGNTPEAAAAAVAEPFRKHPSWNLCTGLSLCGDGMYTVYAIYTTSKGIASPMVMDNIIYLKNAKGDKPSITINNGATTTDNRLVTLALANGLKNIPNDEITMQISNRLDGVDAARPMPYSPTLADWDLCAGLGSVCENATRTVYVKYCARTTCTIVVDDDIVLESPWPDWGVIINENAVSTNTNLVQLRLNTWFDKPGTEVRLSNLADFSVVATGSFTELKPWDLCTGLSNCPSGQYTVYVRYINNSKNTGWPSAQSPRYEDDILMGATPTPSLTPTPLPAGIYINEGASRTTSRVVGLTFSSPFGAGPGVTMRPENEARLSERDIGIIKSRGGGIDSQPSQGGALGFGQNIGRGLGATTIPVGIPELDSGTIRAFRARLAGWDLCEGATECPYGTYKVYVQYYRATGIAMISRTLAAFGDDVSDIYFDTIEYAAPTPTPIPTATVVPTPSGSTTPLPFPTPTTSGTPVPTATPFVYPPWYPPVIASISIALGGSGGVIGDISVISTAAVATTAVVALIPILSSAGSLAFIWQGLMAMLGLLPKRKKVWGTVYDANTKRPIPFAKVQLLDRTKRVLETHIADKEGRYGFLTTPESLIAQHVQILILPSANDYAFPAHTPATVDSFVYNNLYYGELITMSDQQLINFDIPMDPLHPSAAPLFVKSPSILLGASVAAIADAGFWLGLVLIPLNAILMPSPFTLGVLFLFLGTASLRIWGIQDHPFGIVTDTATGRPMSFALITLNDLSGKRVGFTVTDEQGRYFLVADRGTYEMVVFTPATIVPARQVKQVIDASKGWITRQLKL
jgi:hypothetical protein